MVGEPEKYPVELRMSEKVVARVGFSDDRLQLAVKTGFFAIPEVKLSLTPQDLPKIEQVLAEYKRWLKKPLIERQLKGAKP